MLPSATSGGGRFPVSPRRDSVILKPLLPILATLCACLAAQAAPAAPPADQPGAGAAPGKAAPRAAGKAPPAPALRPAAPPLSPGNRDQYALRPEREAQPQSSFGLRMKPGWVSQGGVDDDGR